MGQMYFPGELDTDCSAEIEKIWVEHNECEDGEKGMRIHVTFNANGLKNKQLEVSVYFYYATDNPMIDTNDSYCTSNGHVATHTNLTPPYESCRCEDLGIFMPYSELHINRECACYFFIQIWNGTNALTTSEKVDFYMSLG